TAGLLVVGGPQVEDELVIRRLALRLGARKRKKEQYRLVAVAPQERQAAGRRGGTDVIEEQENMIFFDEPNRVIDGRLRIVAVVVRLDDNLSAVDATQAVDVFEVRHRTAIQFDSQTPARPRESGGHADDDFLGAHASRQHTRKAAQYQQGTESIGNATHGSAL